MIGREPDPGEPTFRLPCGHDVAWIGFDIFHALHNQVDCTACFRERVVAAAEAAARRRPTPPSGAPTS